MDSGQYGEAGQIHPPLLDLTREDDVQSSLNNGGNLVIQNNSGGTNADIFSISSNSQQKTIDKPRDINLSIRFKNTDSGPFCVYVEHESLNVGQLHPMRVGSILNEFPNELQADIREVISVGRNRIKVFMKSAASANSLVGHQIFLKHNLVAYVPQHLVEKRGLVRNVDTSLSEQQLMNKIVSDIPVVNVKRLTRPSVDDKGNKVAVPKQWIVVTFSGMFLPEHIYVDYVRCPVETYVSPVMQCFKCLRYGHSSKLCRGKQRCRECGGEHEGNCIAGVYCIYCKNHSHNSTSKTCPKRKQQENIKKIMATKNISFKEAEKLATNPSLFSSVLKNNPFAPLSNLSGCDFPTLRVPINTSSPVQSNITSFSGRNTGTIKKRKKAVNSQSQPLPTSKVQKQDSSRVDTPVSSESSVGDFKQVRSNLIKAVCELLDRIYNSSSKDFNKEDMTRQVDQIINSAFDLKFNNNPPNDELDEDTTMEL